MLIRNANPRHAREIRELITENNVLRSSGAATGLVEYTGPSVEQIAQQILGPYAYLVAISESAVVGFACGLHLAVCEASGDTIAHAIAVTHPNAFYAELLVVSSARRGEGVGAKLLDGLLDIATFTGREEVLTAVSLQPIENRPSLALVTSLGFRPEKEHTTSNGLVFGIFRKSLTT